MSFANEQFLVFIVFDGYRSDKTKIKLDIGKGGFLDNQRDFKFFRHVLTISTSPNPLRPNDAITFNALNNPEPFWCFLRTHVTRKPLYLKQTLWSVDLIREEIVIYRNILKMLTSTTILKE